jgi:ABC-2 type transport system permease protein
MHELNAILTIAHRDLLKFMRDRPRLISSFVFPFVFIAVLGASFQGSVGNAIGYNFALYTFTGVYAQTLFQSAAFGIISLIEDRDNDFSQAIFVAPISRYSIIFGKILGESAVAMVQGIGIMAFGVIVAVVSGTSITAAQLVGLIPVGIVVCLLGGAFGIIVLANLRSRRAAEQVFPFIMLPQYFLAGVFNPIFNLPAAVLFFSLISPLRYAVDLTRGIFYSGSTDYTKAVQAAPLLNMGVIALLFLTFLVSGTVLFVRSERNR